MNHLKTNTRRLALAMFALAATNSAMAFMVDRSQQKFVTTNVSSYQSAPASQAVVQAQPVYQYQPVVNTEEHLPAPQPQLVQTQTVQIIDESSKNIETSHYSQQAYGSTFDQLALSTSSSAVVVYDLQTGQSIYSKNVDATRSIASISKIMTAMVILDSDLDMREEIVLIPSDLVGAKKASTNLRAGDRMTRSEFTLLMLMKSENPAAKALARTYPGGYDAFINAMNQKAMELGMYQTKFSDSSGLNPRNVSSANDLVKMMQAVNSDPRYHSIRNFSTAPSYDFYITNFESGDRTYKANNTNRLVRAGNHPIGVQKTGYIREAGYCVVMETNVNNRPAIIVLLGGSTSNVRWNDAENILTQLALRQ